MEQAEGRVFYAHVGFREGDYRQGRVWVHPPEGADYQLQHHKYHSPDGHSWGYGGSGPSELAKDILLDLGIDEGPGLYQDFKWAFIAKLDQDKGFRITERDIRAWLDERIPASSSS